MKNYLFTHAIPIGIVLVGIFLSFKTEILKDVSSMMPRPYSFARAQLMWWSLIILSCYTSFYGYEGVAPELDNSCLILLGISLGTITAAKIIDNTELLNNVKRHQSDLASRGFLIDILSDETGISVHRFQAVIFNLVFGVIFINEYLSNPVDSKFIEFSTVELSLMGISSAAYIGVKLNENNARPVVNGETNEKPKVSEDASTNQ